MLFKLICVLQFVFSFLHLYFADLCFADLRFADLCFADLRFQKTHLCFPETQITDLLTQGNPKNSKSSKTQMRVLPKHACVGFPPPLGFESRNSPL